MLCNSYQNHGSYWFVSDWITLGTSRICSSFLYHCCLILHRKFVFSTGFYCELIRSDFLLWKKYIIPFISWYHLWSFPKNVYEHQHQWEIRGNHQILMTISRGPSIVGCWNFDWFHIIWSFKRSLHDPNKKVKIPIKSLHNTMDLFIFLMAFMVSVKWRMKYNIMIFQ